MRPFLNLTVFSACVAGLAAAVPAADPSGNESDAPPLDSVIKSYFEEDDVGQRGTIAAEIASRPDASVEAVGAALRGVQLWPTVATDEWRVAVDAGEGRSTDIVVRVPKSYDPQQRWPMVLALADDDPDVNRWLETLRSGFIIAVPQDTSCLDFHAPPSVAAEPRNWLRALRRHLRIDSDRVYLVGSGPSSDRALLLAIMHADSFAGVVLRDARLAVPYRREMQRILFSNLRSTPVHFVWTEPELPLNTTLSGRDVEVAVCNLFAMKLAEEAGLPFTQTKLPNGETFDYAELREFPRRPRSAPAEVSHWFRYPGQGGARFLRQGGFAEPIWEGDQIDIVTRPHADASDYVRRVLEDKLALVGGRVVGQTITISATKCEMVELHLEPSSVDFTRRIAITYNDKRRFEGRFAASVTTLLESAYEDWEFQHPACCRLRLGDQGRVLPF